MSVDQPELEFRATRDTLFSLLHKALSSDSECPLTQTI